MVWSAPNDARATGYVVTAANWNELAADLNYVGGADGNTKTGVWTLPDGTVALPAYAFTADPNTGLYRVGADDLALAAGGKQVLRSYNGALEIPNTAATDSILRVNDSGTIARFGGNGTGLPNVWFGAQAATAPGYTFYGDADTGLFRSAANTVAIATGGTQQASISAGVVDGAWAPRVYIPASAFVPASTNGATLATTVTGGDDYELQYADGASALTAHVHPGAPGNYAGGTLTFRIYWYTASASQAVTWKLFAVTLDDNSPPTGNVMSYNVATLAGETSHGTAGRIKESVATWSGPGLVGPATMRFALQRDPTHASDTSAETAKVVGVWIEFGS